jgi:sugar lactone lactonase YvrE
MYAAAGGRKQIVAYDMDRKVHVLADGVSPNDLAVNAKGDLYFTDLGGRKVWFLPKGGTPRVVDEGIDGPNGVLLSPDQSLLYVTDAGQLSWVFQIQPDGSLAHKQRYFYLHLPDAAIASGADGMAADTDGRVYFATALGVQVFDQIGKCHAIFPSPHTRTVSNVEFVTRCSGERRK